MSRDAVGAVRSVREALQSPAIAARLGPAASQALGQPVVLVTRSVRPLDGQAPLPGGVAIALASPDRSTLVLLHAEAALAARIAAALLHRTAPWVDELRPVPAVIEAVFGAFAVAVARRAAGSGGLQLRLLAAGHRARDLLAAARGTARCAVDATALVDDEAFSLTAWIVTPKRATQGARFSVQELRALDDLPLALRLVAARSAAPASVVAQWEEGDAWMPGEGWSVRRAQGSLEGSVLLCAATGELAMPANLHADGKIVLGEGIMQVQADATITDADSASSESAPDAADVLGDVPVVVRVEVGAVTLRARQWAALEPGDVVMTGARVADRVTLRVGGVEVAQGELVDVDGELGVRIHAKTHGGGTP